MWTSGRKVRVGKIIASGRGEMFLKELFCPTFDVWMFFCRGSLSSLVPPL